MDDIKIITAYCIMDDVLRHLEHSTHPLAHITDAEVLTVAVVSAMYFHNNHERTLFVMYHLHYLTTPLSTSRFNRRVHALAGWLEYIAVLLGELLSKGETFIIDTMPLPVCKLARARRCHKFDSPHSPLTHFRSVDYLGVCHTKREVFFGWRLHLICTPQRVPVRFQMLPAAFHDLTAVCELTWGLPKGARVYADKGYIDAKTKKIVRPTVRRDGVHLVAMHKKNMKPNTPEEWQGLRKHRPCIETAHSQLVSMGIQSLHARTNSGFAIKVLASLLALTCKNIY
jgi:hypothetical protein